MRVIARLNIGGPAIQAITLTRELERYGYSTLLVRGREDPTEGSMDALASRLGVTPWRIPWMRRDPGWRDPLALAALVYLLRRHRPALVHTHAAKAGALARSAVLISGVRPAPALVHTYHGHSLSGYFSSRSTAAFRHVERALATRTDKLVAVSPEVRDELLAIGVGAAERFAVIRLGFDLGPFRLDAAVRAHERARVRRELGISAEHRVVTLVARLVPIKRVDRFLRVARLIAMRHSDVSFLIVGDGELRDSLEASAEARALGGALVWAGFRGDMPAIYAASDVVALTSDNEGTPVSLIEAQAAGLPVVCTRVGGAATALRDGASGAIVDLGEEAEMARVLIRFLDDPDASARAGRCGREYVLATFGLERLVDDVAQLYQAVLA